MLYKYIEHRYTYYIMYVITVVCVFGLDERLCMVRLGILWYEPTHDYCYRYRSVTPESPESPKYKSIYVYVKKCPSVFISFVTILFFCHPN